MNASPRRCRSRRCSYRNAISFAAILWLAMQASGQQILDTPRLFRTSSTPRRLAVTTSPVDGLPTLHVTPFADYGIASLRPSGEGSFRNISLGPDSFSTSLLLPIRMNGDALQDFIVNVNNFGPQWAIASPGGGYDVGTPIFGLPSTPIDLGIGDYNNDGADDIVLLLQNDTMTIYQGNGQGQLTPINVIVALDGTSAVRMADMNNDGFDELISISNGEGLTSVWRGQGNGKFAFPRSMNLGVNPVDMELADVTGDGLLDVLSVLGTSRIFAVQWNSGDLILTPPAYYSLLNIPTSLQLDDFNGDSRIDAMVSNRYLFEGRPGGTFVETEALLDSFHTVAFDVDGDGRKDLVQAISAGLRIFRTPFGPPTPVTRTESLLFDASGGLLPIDMDLDGSNELLVWRTGSLSLINPGQSTSSVSAALRDVAVGQFTGTPSLDLVVAQNSPEGIRYVELTAAGIFSPTPQFFQYPPAKTVAVADFNGDSSNDIATGSLADPAVLSIGLNANNGQFPGTATSTTTFPALLNELFAGDWDNDGDVDLIGRGGLAADPNRHYVSINNGAGVFASPIEFGDSVADATFTTVADLDRNGRVEIIVSRTGNTPQIFWNNSAAPSPLPDYSPATSTMFGGSIAVGDLNGDGLLDIAGRETDDSIALWLGNGNGTFRTPQSYWTGNDSEHYGIADWDGDSAPDIIHSRSTVAVHFVYNARFADPVPNALMLR